MKAILLFVLLVSIFSAGCGKDELELEKERIRKDADILKSKIDSSQAKVDQGRKELDSLMYQLKKDSSEIDSLMKKINPLKKIN